MESTDRERSGQTERGVGRQREEWADGWRSGQTDKGVGRRREE